jgi:hypothetical protein
MGIGLSPAAAPWPRLIDAYRVPLIFYHPAGALPLTDSRRVAQQADIPASLFDHLGIDRARLLPFGHSVFDPDFEGTAVGEVDDRYWIVSGEHYLQESVRSDTIVGRLAGDVLPKDDAAMVRTRLLEKLDESVASFNELFAGRDPQ